MEDELQVIRSNFFDPTQSEEKRCAALRKWNDLLFPELEKIVKEGSPKKLTEFIARNSLPPRGRVHDLIKGSIQNILLPGIHDAESGMSAYDICRIFIASPQTVGEKWEFCSYLEVDKEVDLVRLKKIVNRIQSIVPHEGKAYILAIKKRIQLSNNLFDLQEAKALVSSISVHCQERADICKLFQERKASIIISKLANAQDKKVLMALYAASKGTLAEGPVLKKLLPLLKGKEKSQIIKSASPEATKAIIKRKK